jgi:hypothetical protein
VTPRPIASAFFFRRPSSRCAVSVASGCVSAGATIDDGGGLGGGAATGAASTFGASAFAAGSAASLSAAISWRSWATYSRASLLPCDLPNSAT